MANLDLIRGRQVVVPLTNKSGGGVIAGDVVIIPGSADDSFTTTTSAANTVQIGVAQETIANNASGRVLVSGYASLVNVNASATRGNYLFTHTVAKQATSNATLSAGAFGVVLSTSTTPDAVLFGLTFQAGSGSVTSVAMTVPAGFSIAGSPITTSGTLALTLSNESANTVLAGPTSGGATTPAFRTLVAADVPFSWIAITANEWLASVGSFTVAWDGTANSGLAVVLPNTDGTRVGTSVITRVGTYTLRLRISKNSNRGILEAFVDGSSIGTFDTYNATPTVVDTTLSVGSLSAGCHTLEIKISGKNASSAGFSVIWFGYALDQTA